MHTLLKGDDQFPTRDWSRLPNALATLESIIHPQNKAILDFLIKNEEAGQEGLLVETGLNSRQLKRRMDSLKKNNIVGEYNGTPLPVYFLEEEYLDVIRESSTRLLQSTLPVI